MLWGWLKAIVQGFWAALFDKAVDEIKKPNTASEAQTPKAEKKAWNRTIEKELDGKDPYIPGVDPKP